MRFVSLSVQSNGVAMPTIGWVPANLSTNRVDFFVCTNLSLHEWELALTTDLDPATNRFSWTDGESTNCSSLFYDCWTLADSDGDELSDGREVRLYGTLRDDPDTDHDSLYDGWEIAWGFNPFDPADSALNSDGDIFSNMQEFNWGLNPFEVNTLDGDNVIGLAPYSPVIR